MQIILVDTIPTGPFSYRWPEGEPEQYTHGWDILAEVDGRRAKVRHAIGTRPAYGRPRVRSVTWLAGNPTVEGVEADDYPESRALLSLLRHPDKRHLRAGDQLPIGYEGFRVVGHRAEIPFRYSPSSLALKIVEDDLDAWVTHAIIRHLSYTSTTPTPKPPKPLLLAPLDPHPIENLKPIDPATRDAVIQALLAHGQHLAAQPGSGPPRFTPNPAANALVVDNPFAFLLAVIFDQGIPAERAWEGPYLLKQRLGHLDPSRLAADSDAVEEAVTRRAPTALHRYVKNVPRWISAAAQRVLTHHAGDAARLWNDNPTAAALERRLQDFPGIGPKKAAMAVEILHRDLGIPIRDLHTGNIAYDVHVRRVFLRTTLAERDDLDHMLAVAKAAHPDHPAALDLPAWDIGRHWCRPGTPDCPNCCIRDACPKDIARAANVYGA